MKLCESRAWDLFKAFQGSPACLLVGAGGMTEPQTCSRHGEFAVASSKVTLCEQIGGKRALYQRAGGGESVHTQL